MSDVLLNLWLDHDPCTYPATPWLVKDQADRIQRKFTAAGRACRFMLLLREQTPGATIDSDSILTSLVAGLEYDSRPVPPRLVTEVQR